MQKLHATMREVAVLQAASEMILSSMDADTVLHQILLIVRNYFDVPHCAVLLVDKRTSELHCSAQIGFDAEAAKTWRFKIGHSALSGHAAALQGPMYVPDVSADARYVAVHPAVKSQLCLPLVVREETVGVLDLQSDKLDDFSDDMIGLFALFAAQAAVALDNARLYNTERKRMRQIEFVNLIARSSTTASSMDQLLQTVTELLADTFEGAEAAILLRTAQGMYEVAAATHPQHLDPERIKLSAHKGLISEALHARTNVLADGRQVGVVIGALSELALPLISVGETFGAVVLSSQQPVAFSAEDRSIAQATADVCATAIRNVQLADELRRVTNTDPLTGAYNQRYLHFSIGQELSRAKRFANDFDVIAIDFKGFRAVNTQGGFGKGDQLLKAAAARLKATLRAVDTVCRYEKDIFIVVLPEISGQQAQTVLQKLLVAIHDAQREVTGEPGDAYGAVVEFPADGDSELHLLRSLLNKIHATKSARSASVGKD